MSAIIFETKANTEKKHCCRECDASFSRPYRLKQHVLLHRNIKTFVCGEKDCNKSYSSKSHLDRHMFAVHLQEDTKVIFSCPKCLKIFSNRQNLKKHLGVKHKKIHFQCDVCGTDFKKKHLLSAHMYQHTFVKSFSCDLCRKEFITLLDKKRHMKCHKTYGCEYCNLTFSRWTSYVKHRRSEHYIKEYICNDCGRKFKQRDHILRHFKNHMDSPPIEHSCPYEDCDKVYSRKNNLNQHIKTKHLQITHKCHICERLLSTKAKLNEHVMKIHLTKESIAKPAKTKATGRKERKDKGTFKNSTALKIAGLICKIDSDKIENDQHLLNKKPESESHLEMEIL